MTVRAGGSTENILPDQVELILIGRVDQEGGWMHDVPERGAGLLQALLQHFPNEQRLIVDLVSPPDPVRDLDVGADAAAIIPLRVADREDVLAGRDKLVVNRLLSIGGTKFGTLAGILIADRNDLLRNLVGRNDCDSGGIDDAALRLELPGRNQCAAGPASLHEAGTAAGYKISVGVRFALDVLLDLHHVIDRRAERRESLFVPLPDVA